jgi:hypothetical protein
MIFRIPSNARLAREKKRMRLQATFLCLSVAACAPPQLSSTPPTLPIDAVIATTIRYVFVENKLHGTPEVSRIRPTRPPEPGDWIICLRSNAPDQPLLYAIFFEDNKYIRSRISIGIDHCDKETYMPHKK